MTDREFTEAVRCIERVCGKLHKINQWVVLVIICLALLAACALGFLGVHMIAVLLRR